MLLVVRVRVGADFLQFDLLFHFQEVFVENGRRLLQTLLMEVHLRIWNEVRCIKGYFQLVLALVQQQAWHLDPGQGTVELEIQLRFGLSAIFRCLLLHIPLALQLALHVLSVQLLFDLLQEVVRCLELLFSRCLVPVYKRPVFRLELVVPTPILFSLLNLIENALGLLLLDQLHNVAARIFKFSLEHVVGLCQVVHSVEAHVLVSALNAVRDHLLHL